MSGKPVKNLTRVDMRREKVLWLLQIMRGIPSLQRKLLYIVAAFVFSFLVYLLLTSNVSQMSQRGKANLQADLELIRGELVSDRQTSGEGRIISAIKVNATHPVKKPDGRQVKRDAFIKPNRTRHLEHIHHLKPQAIDEGKARHESKPIESGQVPTQKPNIPLQTTGSGPYSGPKNERQKAVVEAFMHAWSGYKQYAWGHDELKPLSRGWKEWFGCGLTIVDSLDTMWIMGLKEEFALGRDWVANHLKFDRDMDVQLFEIVIRELGGLMAAYHFSNDAVFLEKAVELSDKLYPCLHEGPSKIPCNRVNLKRAAPRFTEISTAEVGTIQLEFRAVSRAANEPKYEKAIYNISTHLHKLEKLDGLVACFISGSSGTFRTSSTVSMGASADSYYEYLLKQWIQTGKKIDWLRDDYVEAMEGMKKHLLRYTEKEKFAFVGSLHSMLSSYHSIRPEMEHLACFLPGTLALGYLHGVGGQDHLTMARELGRTCYEMYHKMPTGLSPEVAVMNVKHSHQSEDIAVNYGANFNLQRPETVESLFYLYRATGEQKYRDWGWEIFQAFEKHTRVPAGYASIDNVRNPSNVGHRDKMETFYLAETLKYLYLLFSDDPELLPLDKFVINTEAHPLPVYDH